MPRNPLFLVFRIWALLACSLIPIIQAPSVGAETSGTLEGVFNVKDFGAKGDGRTTDTVAVQRAIDAARQQGGVVWLPPGYYLVESLDMTGISRGVTLRGAAPGASNLVAARSGVPVLDLTGSYFTSLRDFQINAHTPGIVPNVGLLLAQTPGIPSNILNLENIYVGGNFSIAALYCHCVCSSSITRCEFSNYYNGPETAAVSFTQSNYANITSKFITAEPKNAGNCSDWTLTGCEIHDLSKTKEKPSQASAVRLDGTMQIRWFGGNISGEGPQLIRMEGRNINIVISGTTLYTEQGSLAGLTVLNKGELCSMSIMECFLQAKDAVFGGTEGAIFDEITFHSKPTLASPGTVKIFDCPKGTLIGSNINCDGRDLRLGTIRKTLLINPGRIEGVLEGVTRVE